MTKVKNIFVASVLSIGAVVPAFAGIVSTEALNSALEKKQDKLTPGDNIKIEAVGDKTVISAVVGTDFVLDPATEDELGGVKSGGDISVSKQGVVTVSHAATADSATTAASATTATKATQDASGNVITTTYATKSEIPTVNNATLTIQKNGTTVDTFTANASANKTINIEVPAAQVQSDWNAESGIAAIANKPTLATVATSGSYDDLDDKPTIPTVNNATLTIQKNGTTVDTFTANASANKTVNITVPTKVSDLTNDSNFITSVPVATATTVGTVKPGTNITIAEDGTISATDTNTTYSTGTASTPGLAKLYTGIGPGIDGTMTQKAITEALGGKQATLTAGDNITITGNTISATDTKYTLPIATADTLGGVKAAPEYNFIIDEEGRIYMVPYAYSAVMDKSGNDIAEAYVKKTTLEALDSTSNGSGAVVTGVTQTNGVVAVTRGNVQIPVGSATGTTYATIWVE